MPCQSDDASFLGAAIVPKLAAHITAIGIRKADIHQNEVEFLQNNVAER